ncbi:hypothetical protein C8F04DRAFT_1364155 [Mycena alexandri]|uniref:Uncharacterized protein n=1 Tax=Mycena alexandri TaxID=1745969 RepID=A0AAD6X1E5_9AGAR|nr:hypothetical protein C8F04DRAFT_1364155 [Mycena alexandri]
MTMGEFVGRYSGEESAWAAGGESEGSARGWRWGWERPMWLSGCTRSTSPSRPSTTLKTSCAAATSKKPSARVPLDADLADGGRANAYADPYAPYTSPGLEGVEYPWGGEGSYNGHGSTAALPLVANASPFQRADMYDDKGRHGGGHGGRMHSRLMLATDERETASNFGSESYAPSRNMFGAGDAKTLPNKDALAGEIQEGETA